MGGLSQPEPPLLVELSEAHEFEIPCDFVEAFPGVCKGEAARWAAWRVTCDECGFKGGARLICTRCKDILMFGDGAVLCDGAGRACTRIYVPAREIIDRIEPLG